MTDVGKYALKCVGGLAMTRGGKNALKCAGAGAVGAAAGAAGYGIIGGVGVALGGTAVGITLGPFMAIGAGACLLGYGLVRLRPGRSKKPPDRE